MQKLLFLDLDGVLNPMHYSNALFKMWNASKKEIKSHDEFGQLFFYQNCEALKIIIDNTGAEIVISSTWRMAGLKQMQQMWLKRGLAGKVIGITPTEMDLVANGTVEFYDQVGRGDEIKQWIKDNDYKGNYVIIDDDNDFLKEQFPFFVKTNTWVGLTKTNAKVVIEILNKIRT